MIYINLDEPYEEAVQALKRYYGEKANQHMVEHLIRQEAIRLGLWPVQVNGQPTTEATS